MKNILSIGIFLFLALCLVSCGSKSEREQKATETEDRREKHDNPNITSLTDEQIRSIGVGLGAIEEKQLTASLKTNGILQVPNQNKASINSVYRGIVKSLLIQPGNSVSKGQQIATISNPEFIEAQQEYLGLASSVTMAEQEYNRQKELNESNAGALKNLQAADAELKSRRTRRSALQQQIRLMGIKPSTLSNGRLTSVLSVRSPIAGVVSDVMVKIGAYIDVTTPVAEVVDNSQLHLDLFVYEKDLPKLKNNQTIHFTLTNNPTKEYDAEIFSLGSSFEGESKAISVHARVKGDKTGLIDGMNITAVISLGKAVIPAVPSEAIVTYQGQDYIFVVTEEHTENDHAANESWNAKVKHKEGETIGADKGGLLFERIPVAKGTTDVGYTEVTLLKQVSTDAKVVVKGAFFVLAKMTNSGDGEQGH